MTVERREFLKHAALILGASLSPACVQTVLEHDPGEPLRADSAVLPPRSRVILEAAADRILPETDTPGALSAGVPDFIELMLAEAVEPEQRASFTADLEALDVLAHADFGKGFAALPGDAQDGLLSALETEEFAQQPAANGMPLAPQSTKPFFAQLKEWTVVGYYTSEVGVEATRTFSHIPGRFDGNVPFAAGQKPWIGGL